MLAQRLREIRLQHGLTQKNIADVLGVDRTTYTYYENGVTTPSPDTLYKLSRIYNMTVGCLMGVEEDPAAMGARVSNGRLVLSSFRDTNDSRERDEKILLMCYRLLPADEKKKVLDNLHQMALEIEGL